MDRGLVPGSIDLLLREKNQMIEVGGRALLQEVVGEHRDEGRGKGDGAAEGNPVPSETLEHLEEREVRVYDGLVEPPLLHYRRVVRVADEGQMSVQQEGEVAGVHPPSASPARGAESPLAPRRASARGDAFARSHLGAVSLAAR
jgi:hypothetical protein